MSKALFDGQSDPMVDTDTKATTYSMMPPMIKPNSKVLVKLIASAASLVMTTI